MGVSALAQKFLESQALAYPNAAVHFRDAVDFCQRKLWHQLTGALEALVAHPDLQSGDVLIQLYNCFICDVETRLNRLRLAQLLIAVAHHFASGDEMLVFLHEAAEKLAADADAHLLVVAEIGGLQLRGGDLVACKEILEGQKKVLDGAAGWEPIIYAAYYKLASEYYKVSTNPGDFYANALMYLAYTPLDTIPPAERTALAVDLSLAALLGPKIYNFGELLQHPIVQSLRGTLNGWLYDILFVFNSGSIERFDEATRLRAAELASQPALASNAALLREKITILCLMEVVFNRAADDRSIPFSVISQETRLPLNEVEFLLMKALSLGLIKGTIDQVARVARITWVQPRVLDIQQVARLKDRLVEWSSSVQTTMVFLEGQTMEFAS